MDISKSKVLITGAGGFIGSHLTEILIKQGADVRAMVHYNSHNSWGNLELLPKDIRENIDVCAYDLTDYFSVHKAMEGRDVVFHLASLIGIPYSYVAPASYVETNIRGTLNVVQAALTCKVQRVVHTSTSEVYGTAQYTPIDEKHPLQPQSPYSASKIAADSLAESYFRSFELPVSTLRPFNTYGPRQSARAVIPTIISQIVSGARTITLGSLSPIRDFTFVEDTARAFIAVAESDKTIGKVCNAGNGKGITIGELANKIFNLMNVEVEVKCNEERVRPSKSEVFELLCNAEKIKNLTGWTPKINFEEGLSQVISFVTDHIDLYKVDSYQV
jgi:NAD dependent epimerase/dehydratase